MFLQFFNFQYRWYIFKSTRDISIFSINLELHCENITNKNLIDKMETNTKILLHFNFVSHFLKLFCKHSFQVLQNEISPVKKKMEEKCDNTNINRFHVTILHKIFSNHGVSISYCFFSGTVRQFDISKFRK